MRREEQVTVKGPERNNNQTECHTVTSHTIPYVQRMKRWTSARSVREARRQAARASQASQPHAGQP